MDGPQKRSAAAGTSTLSRPLGEAVVELYGDYSLSSLSDLTNKTSDSISLSPRMPW